MTRPEDCAGRIHMNLTPKDRAELDSAMHLLSLGKTNLVRRAISLVNMAARAQQSGGALYVRESEDSELVRVHLI